MNPIEWLNQRAPGFDSLSEVERAAIFHFSLLWSFFEAKVLDTNASANKILAISREWAGDGRLRPESFASNLLYFRERYFKDGEATDHFGGLLLRENDNEPLVVSVLKGENNDPGDIVCALLIIVFRLRNNLFHGTKWAYGIAGQFDNFSNANEVLMAALDIHGEI